MPLHRKLSWASTLLVVLLLPPILAAQSPTADLLLIYGHVLTVDAKDSVAQAVAIRHGVIVKVGSNAEVAKFAERQKPAEHGNRVDRRVLTESVWELRALCLPPLLGVS